MTGACCPCIEEDEDTGGKDREKRKDGMIRCATIREEKDNGGVEISEEMGGLPLGSKTIGQLVVEAKEKAGAELRWWDQGDHDSEVTEKGKKLTIKRREVWVNEDLSTIKEGETMSAITQHRKTCKKYKEEQGQDGECICEQKEEEGVETPNVNHKAHQCTNCDKIRFMGAEAHCRQCTAIDEEGSLMKELKPIRQENDEVTPTYPSQ